jgi:hypothetical protein
MWKHGRSRKDGGIGIPTVSYTFTPLLAAEEGPKINTVVVEVVVSPLNVVICLHNFHV